MAGTTYSDVITTNALPDSQRIWYSTELEMTARPLLIFDQPAFIERKEEFGANRGATVVFTTYRQMPPSILPLSENVDVTGSSIQDFQIQFSIQEYGNAYGTSEKLDLLSYQGPISNIVRTELGPQMALTMDTLARNTYWYAPNINSGAGPTYHDYANNKANRAALSSSDVLTSEMVRWYSHSLSIRQVPLIGMQDPSYIALTHPSVIYDLRNDANWKSAQYYAGATKIFTGEEGMIHGMRFIKSTRARIANGGVLISGGTGASQSALAASYPAGVSSITVANAAPFAAGQEITLHNTGVVTTAVIGTSTTWTAPDGQDPTAEEVIIQSVSGNTITLRQKTLLPHSIGDFATEGLDIYPIIFLGGVAPLGKGVAVDPEVRVSLPVDKLRRISYVGWYFLGGFGVVRDWAYTMFEVAATAPSAVPYGI